MSKACSEAGEMAPCRKRLLQKHEALSSDPQHLRKPVMVAPSPGIPVLRVKGGDEPLGLPGPASLAEMLSCGFSEKPSSWWSLLTVSPCSVGGVRLA